MRSQRRLPHLPSPSPSIHLQDKEEEGEGEGKVDLQCPTLSGLRFPLSGLPP
jgi:hypothetical protein